MRDFFRRKLMITAAGLPLVALLPGPAGADGASLPGAAPIHIRKVGLRARDAEQVARWYMTVLGLQRLTAEGDTITLGAGGVALLEIAGNPELRLSSPQDAGLYHTAFLLPTRADLGRWIRYAIDLQIPVDGVADHLVSEAIYLTDPEGNGVEIYADRPATDWAWRGGEVVMGTEALDVEGLLALAPAVAAPLYSAPAGTFVGHVHLKVGDAARAAGWWQDTLQFDIVRRGQGAMFLSTGGYHHHIAANQWQSSGAPPQDPAQTGLAYIELASRLPGLIGIFTDPWGIEVRATQA